MQTAVAVISAFLLCLIATGLTHSTTNRAARPSAQEQRMYTCRVSATGQGIPPDEVQDFISTCLNADERAAR